MHTLATPLLPDSDEAREWAHEELSRGVYGTEVSWWELLWEAIRGLLARIADATSGLGPVFLPLIILSLVVAAIILAVVLGGSHRQNRRRTPAGVGLWEEDDHRTAAQLRDAARVAASAGDFRLAVVEQFRALVRELEERSLLDATAGMTAWEVARLATGIFPRETDELLRAAELFNSVLYGESVAAGPDFHRLLDLDSRLGSADPAKPSPEHV